MKLRDLRKIIETLGDEVDIEIQFACESHSTTIFGVDKDPVITLHEGEILVITGTDDDCVSVPCWK